MMKHLITTEIKQQQTISPQVYQSLHILQMNRLQLDEYVQDAILENPVLEEDEDRENSGVESLDSLREPLAWTWEEGTGWREGSPSTREPAASDAGESLREHLASQYDPALTSLELQLLDSVVNFLDESGYLTAEDAEISAASGFSQELVGYGVAYLQTLDPLGICARSLTECLCIQLNRLGYRDAALSVLAQSYLEDIAAGKYTKIARALGRTPQEVRGLCDSIQALCPKPGASFGGVTAAPVHPDILVTAEQNQVFAEVNDRGGVRPQINNYYVRLAQKDEYGEATAYLEEKLAQARWVIQAVERRKSTLQAVADCVIACHKPFFLHRDGALSPMTLGRAAELLGLHESTISRAISGKYLQCWRGTFPIKYFFAAGVGSARGGVAVSRNTAKERIRAIIDTEDKKSPLSDSRLVQLLVGEGIHLSRRVIAKYRDELFIPSTRTRQERTE